jgi:putative transposase
VEQVISRCCAAEKTVTLVLARHRHQEPKKMSSDRKKESRLLAELAKTVIEAALEAEMVEHLESTAQVLPLHGRRNSRNGSRPKTVRTVIGPLTIEVPRDRWGTFEPLTVGKWQREVVGVDRVLLPLAAKGAPLEEMVTLLSQVYPSHASSSTLTRIAATARARLADWHERTFEAHFPVLHVHVSTLRAGNGQPTGFPVLSVVGATAPDAEGGQRRELLSLHAVRADRGSEPWRAVVSDLRRRQLRGVRTVVGAASAPFRAAVAGAWPVAI